MGSLIIIVGITIILLIAIAFPACAQDTAAMQQESTIRKVDTFILADSPQKKFLRASLELVGAQVVPWAWNKLYRKKDFTRVSLQSIGRNLNPENWRWDDNTFLMNQFVHPYHGSVYYNSFRCNGYNFWASGVASIAGSFIWEIAGENHLPAQNDLINTSLGGIALGEIAHRLSPYMVNERQRGVIRQVREVAGLLVNPINGINRILDKKWGRYNNDPRPTPGMLRLEADIGSRRYNVRIKDETHKGRNEFFARLSLDYGDPYHDFKTPFASFSAATEFGTSDSATFNMARINASLYGWKLKGSSRFNNVANITMNYDYYRNTAFAYGSESFNMNMLTRFKPGFKSTLEAAAGAGWIALAAVPNEYLYYGEGRNYDYCMGLATTLSGRLILSNKISYRVNYRHNIFHTINGSVSSHRLNTVNSELKYVPGKSFFCSLDWGKLILNSTYQETIRTHRHYQYLRVSAGYSLKF